MITLVHRFTHAVVNPDGAWLSELGVSSDQILFPQTILTNKAGEQKARGGMHVCLPNFGPGGYSGLPQHGFGRTSMWSVVQQSESSVTLELEGVGPSYAGLVSTLTYHLDDNSLTAHLELSNKGTIPLRVTPGFHPYFSLEPSETAVKVNDHAYELNTLAGTEYVVADMAQLHTSARDITITQENLTTWAIWTDLLGNYVCIEPTFGGNRFLDEEKPDEQLTPNSAREYSLRITF